MADDAVDALVCLILGLVGGVDRVQRRSIVMEPPMFSIRPTGNTAQHYMHRARMFRNAAIDLPDSLHDK